MQARELIASALGRAPRSVVEVETGYDFSVRIVDDELVFRFPRRAEVEEALRMELELLPRLARALPVEVPAFTVVSSEPLVVSYPLLRGTPLVDEPGVRELLQALHGLDPAGLDLHRPDWIELYREKCAGFAREVLPLLERDLRPAALALFAEVETLAGFEPALVHADLAPEHLLARGGRLVAVLDWADARVGDPALDYAWLLNGPFPGWEVDDDLRRRARFYHRLGPWFQAHYSRLLGKPEQVAPGLAGIRARL